MSGLRFYPHSLSLSLVKPMIRRIALCCLAAALVGCGPARPSVAPVSGTVTLDGTPLPGAVVTFNPVGGNGAPAVGNADGQGKYSMTDMSPNAVAGAGAAPGDYEVGVMWYKPSANDTSKMTGESASNKYEDNKATATGVTGPETELPVAYQNPQTSGIRYTVKPGQNTFDIALDSKFKGAGK
jgi:hypothetical protein